MKRKVLVATFVSLLYISGFSQTGNYWQNSSTGRSAIVADKATNRLSYPNDVKLFNLNIAPLKQVLLATVNNTSSSRRSAVVTLPNAAGGLEDFEVFEASNFEPALQARFPEIRSFSGKGITDKAATLKLSISPNGVQAMVFRTAKDNEFIEPFSQDHNVYAVFASQRSKGSLPWTCSTNDRQVVANINQQINGAGITNRSTGDLKTLRLAQSVTAEYSNYFGATSASQVGLVLAAINATLTRCNGVYEKDLALHLNLVATSTNVIYYNPSTDPYSAASTGAGGAWNGELQNTLTSVIGEANYDIGHLFGASGGGGNAGCIGCICVNGSKGSGFTSPADGVPQGDNFDIDYVVHEVGHQLGANHTFSMNNEGTGVNVEVGSGITIMGYAGITAQDVAPHSIDIYHAASIAQIQANLATKTCAQTFSLSGTNATPVVAAVSSYTIPISTPFALTGAATDANAGDVLTYCWEQNDNASRTQTGTSSVASATKKTGPSWISFKPTTSPIRYFPQLSTILAGGTVTGPLPGGDAGANIEALSSVARTLSFRLTVRDNAVYSSTTPSVGQTSYTDAVVTVSATAGPFVITAPNTAVTWAGGSTQNVTWNVASTTATPVSCANVKVSLSTDGGLTFPTVLIASTPNDGTAAVTVPNTPSTTARIKVEAVGNIFFDISNTNFTIGSGTATCNAPTGLAASAITTNSATLSWAAVSGAASYSVDYKLTSTATWTNAAAATTATSVNISGLSAGTVYDWRVRTNCAGSASAYTTAQFTTATATAVCPSPYDVSTNDNISGAATIPLNTAVYGLINPRKDIDNYKFVIASGGTISLTLSSLPADYDLKLTNSAGTQLAASENGGTTGETINYTAAAGTYYAQVYPYRTAFDANDCYTLNVQTGTASRSIVEVPKATIVSIYPNPVHTEMKITTGTYTEVATVAITDMFGRRMLNQNFTGSASISTAKLAAGVYMITITDKNGVILKQDKIVKE
jgi:hypothetical protein